ncbi:MAG: hemerythrin domain-containing protein [Gammaproteobacteria bacterium]|nr:hemerythrin domain-containing protein [Gammaproteobacteria bacterium]
MIPIAELKNENIEIENLRKILAVLVGNAEMHTNSIFCELLERFQAKLSNHLKHEARSLYPDLLTNDNKELKTVAKRFLDNTFELERLLNNYIKHWCHKLENKELNKFIKETEEVFTLVEKRIHLEENKLFPLLA